MNLETKSPPNVKVACANYSVGIFTVRLPSLTNVCKIKKDDLLIRAAEVPEPPLEAEAGSRRTKRAKV